MIPKIIHNIWIQGYNNLPNINKINQEKIKKLNPEWEFIIWDELMIKKLLKKYPTILAIYKNAKNLSGIITTEATKSDIARYVIMKEYGGLYYDYDFECISSFDKLFLNKKEKKYTIYIASSKIDFLEYIYQFDKPKYCSCFMGMEKNHPIWDKVFKILENTHYKSIIGSALDKTLQQTEQEYNIINLTKINSHYQCLNQNSICFTTEYSSWNPIRPFIKYINCYYKQVILFILILIIIFIVEKLYHYNTSIYGAINYIPGFGVVQQTITITPTKKKDKKNKTKH